MPAASLLLVMHPQVAHGGSAVFKGGLKFKNFKPITEMYSRFSRLVKFKFDFFMHCFLTTLLAS